MKKILFPAVTFLLISSGCMSQSTVEVPPAFNNYGGEFKTYNNGLIYSETTMHQLSHIVDSLNLKFKRCDLTRKYYALTQGVGHSINLISGNVKQALADINANINFLDFEKKYKKASINKEMLILKTRFYNDYSKKWVVEFSGEIMEDYNEPSISLDDNHSLYDKPLQGKWIVNYNEKTSYSKASLEAFYITEEFKSTELPAKYARMILYSDCVVDTTADIFNKNSIEDGMFSQNTSKSSDKINRFTNFLDESTNHITEKDVPVSYGEYKLYALDSIKSVWIMNNLVQTDKFKQLLSDAIADVKQKHIRTNDEFENYVANYYSKADALEMKRNRKVMGMCSMDQRPRQHALNIALLSAESINWEVFLRAHLNIMNDRFERVSDGSYAWEGRKTYIKELEELNIEVQELLFGISLRIKDPVEKHYYGSIGRLGRALAETKNRLQLEEQLLSMIKDNELDTYNRILMHFLFLNYSYYLPQKESRMANLVKLEDADKTLPVYVLSRIKINKKNFEKQD